MLTTVLTLDGWAVGWIGLMGAIAWQSAIVIAIVGLVAWCLRRSSPVVRYWLWQIVAVKLLLMPLWTLAVPVPGWLEGAAARSPAATADSGDATAGRPAMLRPLTAAPGEEAAVSLPQSPDRPALQAITWQAWLLLAWAAAVLWQVVRIGVQRLSLARLLRRAAPADAELARRVAGLAVEIGLSPAPATVTVDEDCPLFVCGLRRPLVVLPVRIAAALSPGECRQVILHELAHVKRGDLVWGWPMQIARIVYFFHPMVWYAAYRLRLECELACDQLAIAHSGHAAAEYAQTLVQVVRSISVPVVASTGLSGGNGSSENRLARPEEMAAIRPESG